MVNIEGSEQICRLCDGVTSEDEEHVVVLCPRYEEIKLAHTIDLENFYSLFQLVYYD